MPKSIYEVDDKVQFMDFCIEEAKREHDHEERVALANAIDWSLGDVGDYCPAAVIKTF